MPDENVTKDGKDRGVTKDGDAKQKTGPKLGSHHSRGKAIRHSTAGKTDITRLATRVEEVEEAAGLNRGGPLDPRSYKDGQVPMEVLDRARAQVMRLLGTRGMTVAFKSGGSVRVHDVKREVVLIWPPNHRGSGSKNCIPMPLQEFFLKAGLTIEA